MEPLPVAECAYYIYRRYKEGPPNLFQHSSYIHVLKDYPFLLLLSCFTCLALEGVHRRLGLYKLLYNSIISGWHSSWPIEFCTTQLILKRIIFTMNYSIATNFTKSNGLKIYKYHSNKGVRRYSFHRESLINGMIQLSPKIVNAHLLLFKIQLAIFKNSNS